MRFFKNSFANLSFENSINKTQILLVFAFSLLPLFIQMPFKINLFLAWEGAYRLSLGQIPHKDFSLPMGFVFWIIPAAFFKVFGPYMASLVKAQVLINIIGGLVFRSILKKLDVPTGKILIALLIYCISFILINFWPWYNHTVFIFELVALRITLSHIFETDGRKRIIKLLFASLFITLSFFTKQDGGALSFILIFVLLLYNSYIEGTLKWIGYYIVFTCGLCALFILPFVPYDITYWFNVGQAPHNSRIQLSDFLKDIFEASEWIKFYLFLIVLLALPHLYNLKAFLSLRKEFIFFLLTVAILIQAMIIQVTSYIPHNVNVYFHSFAMAYILYSITNLKLEKFPTLLAVIILTMFWWSADYWRYSNRLLSRTFPSLSKVANPLDKVSKYSWALTDEDKSDTKKINWVPASYKSLKGLLLPEETLKGIDAIMSLEVTKKKNLKVLNMSELTILACEIGYQPPLNHPLWYHKNVSIFDREIEFLCSNIKKEKYDLVLFEVIPNLNQFYPEAVRECLKQYYSMSLKFQAPRDNATNYIEVYTKRVN